MGNVYVYDVDDLNGVAAANREARQDEAELAEKLVRQQAERFIAELSTHTVKPTIVDLQTHAQLLKATELERAVARLRAGQNDLRGVDDSARRWTDQKVTARRDDGAEAARSGRRTGSGCRCASDVWIGPRKYGMTLKIGTRGSALALWQAHHVADLLQDSTQT